MHRWRRSDVEEVKVRCACEILAAMLRAEGYDVWRKQDTGGVREGW
jgi:hypothetical protein